MSQVRQYELIYITPPETSEDALGELHQQVEKVVHQFGGNIEKSENWGRRKLAYEIARHREGVYVFDVINGPAALNAELSTTIHAREKSHPGTQHSNLGGWQSDWEMDRWGGASAITIGVPNRMATFIAALRHRAASAAAARSRADRSCRGAAARCRPRRSSRRCRCRA